MRQGRVFKRSGGWAFVVDVNLPGAPRKQRTQSGFRTRAEAVAAMHGVQESLRTGSYVNPDRVPLGMWMREVWLPAVKGQLRPTTWDSYEAYFRLYVLPRLGEVPMQSLTRSHLRLFYADLEANGAVRGGGLNRKTVHNVHLMLLKAFNDAVDDQLLPRKPAERAHRAGPNRFQITTWTAPQLRTFLEHAQSDRLYALWRLAAATGMRRAELLGLRWRDVNQERLRLSVVQTRLKAGGTTYFDVPKTPRSRRSIALDPVTVEILRRHQVRQSAERLALGPAYVDHDLLFCHRDGSPLDPDGTRARFYRLSAEAGLPRIRLHDLRHTHATLGLLADVHPKIMQERLGHSSVAFTLDIYSHAVPTMQDQAAQSFSDLIDSEGRATR